MPGKNVHLPSGYLREDEESKDFVLNWYLIWQRGVMAYCLLCFFWGVSAVKTRNVISSLYKVKYRGEAVITPHPIAPV